MLFESLNKTCELLAYSDKVSEKLSVRESSRIRGNTTHTIKCSIREVKRVLGFERVTSPVSMQYDVMRSDKVWTFANKPEK